MQTIRPTVKIYRCIYSCIRVHKLICTVYIYVMENNLCCYIQWIKKYMRTQRLRSLQFKNQECKKLRLWNFCTRCTAFASIISFEEATTGRIYNELPMVLKIIYTNGISTLPVMRNMWKDVSNQKAIPIATIRYPLLFLYERK